MALVATDPTWDHARVGSSRKKEEPRSPFVAAALALDAEFEALERLATALERAPVENEKGLERARRLLGEVEACRERLGARLQAFARALDEARARSEQANERVAARTAAVSERLGEGERLAKRLEALGNAVGQLEQLLAGLRRPDGGALGEEERGQLAAQLPEVDAQLGVLVDEARRLMDDAHAARLWTLQRGADTLRQSLQGARHRLAQIAQQPGGSDEG